MRNREALSFFPSFLQLRPAEIRRAGQCQKSLPPPLFCCCEKIFHCPPFFFFFFLLAGAICGSAHTDGEGLALGSRNAPYFPLSREQFKGAPVLFVPFPPRVQVAGMNERVVRAVRYLFFYPRTSTGRARRSPFSFSSPDNRKVGWIWRAGPKFSFPLLMRMRLGLTLLFLFFV